MRVFDARTTAIALQAPIKWVDNVLSHHDIRGVERARRGVDRHLSFEAIVTLSIVWVLAQDLGIPLAKAVGIAERLADSAQRDIMTPSGVRLVVDVDALMGHLKLTLSQVAETSTSMRRGPRASDSPAANTIA